MPGLFVGSDQAGLAGRINRSTVAVPAALDGAARGIGLAGLAGKPLVLAQGGVLVLCLFSLRFDYFPAHGVLATFLCSKFYQSRVTLGAL